MLKRRPKQGDWLVCGNGHRIAQLNAEPVGIISTSQFTNWQQPIPARYSPMICWCDADYYPFDPAYWEDGTVH